MSSEKKMKVATSVLDDVCSKSGVDSVSGNQGSRKFVNFMKMQQVASLSATHYFSRQRVVQEGNMNFENLNMGNDVSDKFKKFCSYLVSNHASDVVNAYRTPPPSPPHFPNTTTTLFHSSHAPCSYGTAPRLYDVDLKKLLCKTLSGACVGLQSGADL